MPKYPTLRELVETKYPDVPLIGVYVTDGPIYPDYTDEYLETHGDKEVVSYFYSEAKNVLVVSFDVKFY